MHLGPVLWMYRPKYTMMPRTLEATGGIDIAGTKQKWEVESQLLGET